MAAAHLMGEAGIWYDANKATYNRWMNNGNAGNQLASRLQRRFATPERRQRWQRDFYEVKQLAGESVEQYAQRFMNAARRIGDDVAEIGKAGTFTQGLLLPIQRMAVLGDQSTLDQAIESAKKGETSAMVDLQQMGYVKKQENQIKPDDYRVYENMKKEKTNKDIDDLTEEIRRMKIMMLQDTRNRNRNYQNNNYERRQRNKNYQNNDYGGEQKIVTCWNCGEEGHYANKCEKNKIRNNNNNRRNQRQNNQRNGNRTSDQSLNYLSATFTEDEEALDYTDE